MQARQSSHAPAIGPGVTGGPLAHPERPTGQSQDRNTHVTLLPTSGNEALVVDPAALTANGFKSHTQYPYVTGTSVLGVTYKDGVLIACDTLGAYGSTKRYKSFQRLTEVNGSCVVGAGGELSDYQQICKMLDELATEDFCMDDGHTMTPSEVFSYLTRVMYARRNKFDPLWNSVVVGGVNPDGTPFLGNVSMIGTNYTDETIATGFGNHLARPLMREKHRPDMSEEEAIKLLHECLLVLYYRDKTSINKFQVAKVTKDGSSVSEPFSLETKWDYKLFENPSAKAVGTW